MIPTPGQPPGAARPPPAHTPLYRQIYDRFRAAVASGVLKPGDRLPSVRALTRELGVARGTIEAAYSLLAAEGYIQTRGQAGTVVTPGLSLPPPTAPAAPAEPAIPTIPAIPGTPPPVRGREQARPEYLPRHVAAGWPPPRATGRRDGC